MSTTTTTTPPSTAEDTIAALVAVLLFEREQLAADSTGARSDLVQKHYLRRIARIDGALLKVGIDF